MMFLDDHRAMSTQHDDWNERHKVIHSLNMQVLDESETISNLK